MNLVVGATGLLGGEICRLLSAKGKPVRALVRPTADKARIEKLRSLGVELVQGDLKDRPSLDGACRGVTTVISTAATTISRQPGDTIQKVEQEGQISLIDAARAAAVSHFIYISYSGNIKFDDPLTTAKRTVEQHVQRSGLVYTILRPSMFMEIWLSPAVGFDFVNAKAMIYGKGQNIISWISLTDVAKFAVESLDDPAARNKIIELGGPEALSPLEVVKIFEELGGRKFEVQLVPEEALTSVAQKISAADDLQRAFAALLQTYAKGDSIDMRATLQTFPLQLTSVRDYARRMLSR